MLQRKFVLDTLLLAFVKSGISTPFDLRKRTAISPGASIKSLERLEAEGFLAGGQVEARRKRAFSITPRGSKELASRRRQLRDEVLRELASEDVLQELRGVDIQTAIRAAILLWPLEHERSWELLTAVADSRKAQAKELLERAEGMTIRDFPELYSFLATLCRGTVVKAEGDRLAALAPRLNALSNAFHKVYKGF